MNILFLIDYSHKSGFGHINRSLALASRFTQLGHSIHYLLSDLKLPEGCFSEFQGYPFSDRPFFKVLSNGSRRLDTYYIFYLINKWDPIAIVIDSYSISRNDILKLSGKRKTIIFERADMDGYCDVLLDFMPIPQASDSHQQRTTKRLQGPKFFISREFSPGTQKRTGVVLHTGGSFRYDQSFVFFKTCADFFRSKLHSVSWVILNIDGQIRLLSDGLAHTTDSFIYFDPSVSNLWSSFDYVVGPPSSSLFESLIQKCIPITTCTAFHQNDDPEQWLKIGHLLHLDRSSSLDPDFIKSYCKLAIECKDEIRAFIQGVENKPNPSGCEFLAKNIIDILLSNTTTEECTEGIPDINERMIVPCTADDISNFLKARNLLSNRLVSTSDRLISWSEHIRWWLLSSVSRYKLVMGTKVVAYIWYGRKCIESMNYLYGGWFPAGNSANLMDALEIIKWQVHEISPKYPMHKWIATFERSNSAIPILNKRMGFIEATNVSKRAAHVLFPGTSESQIVLEYTT